MKKMLTGFLFLNLFWLTGAALLRSPALPGPMTVYARLGEAITAGLLIHAGASILRVMTGMALALLIGLPLGLLMAGSVRWGRLLTPLVYFSYPIPKTALLPVAMLLLGLGEGSKLLIMTLTTVFQVIVAVRDAALCVDPALYDVAKSANLTKRCILCGITLPAILPSLFTALRVGAGTALAILLIVEAYGTRAGLGYFILDAWSRISYSQMYAGILTLAVLGAAVFLMLDLLAVRLCPWAARK